MPICSFILILPISHSPQGYVLCSTASCSPHAATGCSVDAVPCRLLHNSNANGQIQCLSKAAHNCNELVKAMHARTKHWSRGNMESSETVSEKWFIDNPSPKKATETLYIDVYMYSILLLDHRQEAQPGVHTKRSLCAGPCRSQAVSTRRAKAMELYLVVSNKITCTLQQVICDTSMGLVEKDAN